MRLKAITTRTKNVEQKQIQQHMKIEKGSCKGIQYLLNCDVVFLFFV